MTTRGVWFSPEGLSGADVVAFGQRVEALGYETLWVGETFGRDPFAQLSMIGATTSTLGLATGIANIWEVAQHVRGEGLIREILEAFAEPLQV